MKNEQKVKLELNLDLKLLIDRIMNCPLYQYKIQLSNIRANR